MIIRIVRMTFMPEKVEAFLANFEQHKAQIRHFEGCTHLELLRDKDMPHILVTYSYWEGEEYLEKYRNSSLFKEVWAKTKIFFAEKPIAFSLERFIEVE